MSDERPENVQGEPAVVSNPLDRLKAVETQLEHLQTWIANYYPGFATEVAELRRKLFG